MNLKEKLAQYSCTFSRFDFCICVFCICVFVYLEELAVWVYFFQVGLLSWSWTLGGFLAPLHCQVSIMPYIQSLILSHPIYSLLSRPVADNLFSWPSMFPVNCFIFSIGLIDQSLSALKSNNCSAKGFLKPFCTLYRVQWYCKIPYFFWSCTNVVFQNTISSLFKIT